MRTIPDAKLNIKDSNCAKLLMKIRQSEKISRADLAKWSGLTAATVSSLTAELQRLDVIRETGVGQSSGGRMPILYELTSQAYAAIAIELAPTYIRVALVTLSGECVEVAQERLGQVVEVPGTVDKMFHLIGKVTENHPHQLVGIGVAMHGLVDSEQGVSLFAPAFKWRDVPLAALMQAQFPQLPIYVDNDVRAMALGEMWFGRAALLGNYVYMNIDDGIGAAIVSNGELLRGRHFSAGEIGHIYVGENQRTCFCGKSGCLSTFASGTSIQDDAAMHFGKVLSIEQLIDMAKSGDALAIKLFSEAGQKVGEVLAVVAHLVDPTGIIVAGAVTTAEPWFGQAMQKAFDSKVMVTLAGQLDWHLSSIGVNRGVVGAAAMVFKPIFDEPIQSLSK